MKRKLLLSAGLFVTAGVPVAALAETSDMSEADSEIVITGSRAANASINGLEVDPLLLPQNVRVLDERLIAEAGYTDLSQLFDLAGGMSRQNSFGGAWDAYAIRGFSGDINQGPDLLVNRFTANRGFNARRDVVTVESFQVLKGPASALSGKGEPGGSINIVTKAPQDEFHAAGEFSYGSFNTWRGSFDIGGPAAGGLGVRMIGVYQAGDSFRDFNRSDRLLLAPSIAWSPSDAVRLLYQLEYNLVHFTHDRGLVAVNGDGKALPRSRFLGEPNDGQMEQRTSQHQGTLMIDLADGVAFEAGVQYRDGKLTGQSTHNSLLVGTQLRRQLRVHDYEWQDLSARAELSINTALLGLSHQFRIGGDIFRYDQRRRFFRFSPTAANPYDIDIFNPVYGQRKPVATLNQDLLEQLRGESVYAQDMITLGARFSLLLGVRHDWIRQANVNYRANRTDRQRPSQTSPRAAFTFAPSDNVSAYVSWGKSFRFNQGVAASAEPFAPERGEAWEGGVKYALLDKRLTGTLSLFRITKDNILVTDPANSGFQIAAGRARSKGVEFDANLKLDDRFALTMVYAYTDAKVIEDTRAALLGSGLSNIPKHSGALYGHWQSNGDAPGSIGIGGGLTYVGARPGDDVASGFRLPDYATARVNLSWQVSGGVRLHLDADNLFDTYYLDSSYSDVWITPGGGAHGTGAVGDRPMIRRTGSVVVALVLADPALAQRTDENAVREAEDGFGKSVGNESVGIYASGEVRGFSANDAGNARIEGLYFDRAGAITDVIVRGTTVRLGLTAFGYPFPAPTGIVDTELRRAGVDPVVSVRLSSGEYLGSDLVADAAIPVGEKVGVNIALGLFDDQYVSGASAWFVSYGSVVRWRPAKSVELTGFFARYDYGDEEQSPTLYTSGSFLPPTVERRRFYGQQWADWRGHSQNYGGLAKASLGEWQFAAGLFNSRFTRDDFASLYFDAVDRSGRGRLVVVSGEDQRSASTSGEARASRVFVEGARRHRLLLSVRGRSKQSDYGGYHVADLGAATIGVSEPRPEPDRRYGALTEDRVRQMNYALGYEMRWPGVGELNLGVTRSDYRKTVAQPGRAAETSRDRPWLWNAALAITPGERWTLYGAMTRGLEESGTAPGNAVNRNAALPALRTKQKEIGLRYALPGGMRLVTALFDIRKPYFEIDSRDGVYRILGTVIHRGAEFSLSGEPLPGLNLVAGAVLLRPCVTGQAVDEGRLGAKPVGRTGVLIDVNGDFRIPGMAGASLDLRVLHEGDRVARADNRLDIPARTTIDLGARYRTTIGKVPATFRFQVRNIANVYGWRVFGGGGFAPVPGRRVIGSITADF